MYKNDHYLFIAILSLLPITWIQILDRLNIPISPFPLIVSLAVCDGLLGMRRHGIEYFISSAKAFTYFNIAYASYLGVASLSIIQLENPVSGFVHLIKHAGMFCMYLLMAARIRRLDWDQLRSSAALSLIISLTIFLGYSEYVLRSRGSNLIATITEGLINGDRDFYIHNLLGAIANFEGVQMDRDEWYGAGVIKNVLASAFVLLLLLNIGTLGSSRKPLGISTILQFVAIAICLSVILLSNSRTTYLVLAIVFLTSQMLRLIRYRSLGISVACVGLVLITSAIFLLAFDLPVGKIAFDSFASLSSDERLSHYGVVLKESQSKLLFGHGFSAFTSDEFQVHNYMLGGLFEMGLIGFLIASTVAFFFVVELGINTKSLIASNLPPALFSLGLCPLFQIATGSDGGRFTPTDWVAMATIAGLATSIGIRGGRDSSDPA